MTPLLLLTVMRMALLLMCVERVDRTVNIEASTVEIEERGVKLRLTVVDTPGFSDAVNCNDWYAANHSTALVHRGKLKTKSLTL